jgi:hypothetical protein
MADLQGSDRVQYGAVRDRKFGFESRGPNGWPERQAGAPMAISSSAPSDPLLSFAHIGGCNPSELAQSSIWRQRWFGFDPAQVRAHKAGSLLLRPLHCSACWWVDLVFVLTQATEIVFLILSFAPLKGI